MKIYEKITDGKDTWYEEISSEDIGRVNAYYAVVGEKHIPLPMFFPHTAYRGLGQTIFPTSNHSMIPFQKDLPKWASAYAEAWSVSKNVRRILLRIQKYGRVSAFWATFDCYRLIIGTGAWYKALDWLPEEILEIACRQGGIETNLDWSSFGCDSFFGTYITNAHLSEHERSILKNWKDAHSKEYGAFKNAIDAAMFAELQADPDLEDWIEAEKLAYTD
jgi:hypothetical protein